MALSDIQPSSWYENWQNAAPSLGYQYRDEGDYSRWVQPGGGEEGAPSYLTFDEQGQPRGIDPQKAYRQDLAKQGYVPFSSLDEIQGIAQVAKDAYGRPFYGDVNAFLNYGFGPGTQVLQDPTHGLLVKAGDPQKALEPSAVIYPQRQSDGSFLDTVFDFVGNAGPAIIPSLLVPGGQFMAFKTGLGSLADYVVKGALQGALGGGDLDQIIQSGLLGGASGEFASAISPTVKDALGSIGITDPTAVRAAVSSVTSGVREAVFGEGDPLASALKTGLNTYLPQVAAELFPAPVEEAKYSPTEQVATTPDTSWMLAQGPTGTMTDVSPPILPGYKTSGGTGTYQDPFVMEPIFVEMEEFDTSSPGWVSGEELPVGQTVEQIQDQALGNILPYKERNLPIGTTSPTSSIQDVLNLDLGTPYRSDQGSGTGISSGETYSPVSSVGSSDDGIGGTSSVIDSSSVGAVGNDIVGIGTSGEGTGLTTSGQEGFGGAGGTEEGQGAGGFAGVDAGGGYGGEGAGGYPMPVPEPAETFQPTPDEGEPIEEPLASSGGISTSSVGRYTTPARRTGTSPISTAYLARGIVGSPEITGSPVFGTEKGKQRKVWNIKSLRKALNIA